MLDTLPHNSERRLRWVRRLLRACPLGLLFFAANVQNVEAERFDVDALPINLSVGECH